MLNFKEIIDGLNAGKTYKIIWRSASINPTCYIMIAPGPTGVQLYESTDLVDWDISTIPLPVLMMHYYEEVEND